eukprot:m.182884 g.182884  ORF g.182884 m.182884 type:complete len:61 (+) comp16890_c0_seq3:92-274(+)
MADTSMGFGPEWHRYQSGTLASWALKSSVLKTARKCWQPVLVLAEYVALRLAQVVLDSIP